MILCAHAPPGRLVFGGQEPEVSTLYPEVAFPVPRGTASLAQLATWLHDDSTHNDMFDALDWGGKEQVRIMYCHMSHCKRSAPRHHDR